jgi:hypothetical protein
MAAVTDCLGAPPPSEDRVAVDYSLFSDVLDNLTYSTVASYSSEQRVDADSALFRHPRVSDCFTRAFDARAAEAGLEAEGYTVRPHQVTVTPTDGEDPDSIVATMVAILPVVTPDGQDMTFYTEYVFVADRWTEAIIGFATVDAEPDEALRARLVQTVADRLADL